MMIIDTFIFLILKGFDAEYTDVHSIINFTINALIHLSWLERISTNYKK